ncbi:hypothetical protein COOONC_10492 [Cooperia oncophora]
MGAALSMIKGEPVSEDMVQVQERRPMDAAPEPVAGLQNSGERVVPPEEVEFLSPIPPNYLTREKLVDLSVLAASQPEPPPSPALEGVETHTADRSYERELANSSWRNESSETTRARRSEESDRDDRED